MFTTRSEFRLSARADNADLRLTAKGRIAGVVGDKRWKHFQDLATEISELKALLENTKMSSHVWAAKGFRIHQESVPRSAYDLLRLAGVSVDSLVPHLPLIGSYLPQVRARVGIEGVYAPYVERQKLTIISFERDERLRLPTDLDYTQIHGLSSEEVRVLQITRPESVGMARRCEGVTPAGALRLLEFVKGIREKEKRRAVWQDIEARKEKFAVAG